MAKGKKGKKKSATDWDALFDGGGSGGGGGGKGEGDAGGGGWHTGPASMALDGEGDDDYGGGGGGAAAGPSGGGAGDVAMEVAVAAAAGKKRKKKGAKRGGGGGGPAGGGGGDEMDTSEAPGAGGGGRLGVSKRGMKVGGKRGNRTANQLKRKMGKQDKALAFAEKLEARAVGKMTAKQRKAALKTIY